MPTIVQHKLERLTSTSELKTNDKVTIVNLRTGDISEGHKVIYVSKYAEDGFAGIDTEDSSGVSHTFTSGTVRHIVVFRHVVPKPANWPPKENDVWRFGRKGTIGSRVYHVFAGDCLLCTGAGKDFVRAETLLQKHAGTAELLYRLS